MIRLLLLRTAHRTIFHHCAVRTSTTCYGRFILAMRRSPGFASVPCHCVRPFKTRFPCGSVPEALNLRNAAQLAGSFSKRHAVTRDAAFAASTVLRQLVGTGFQVLFTSLQGSFSSVAHATSALSVANAYLALGGGPPGFTPGSTCPTLLGVPSASVSPFPLQGSHLLWPGFPVPFT